MWWFREGKWYEPYQVNGQRFFHVPFSCSVPGIGSSGPRSTAATALGFLSGIYGETMHLSRQWCHLESHMAKAATFTLDILRECDVSGAFLCVSVVFLCV